MVPTFLLALAALHAPSVLWLPFRELPTTPVRMASSYSTNIRSIRPHSASKHGQIFAHGLSPSSGSPGEPHGHLDDLLLGHGGQHAPWTELTFSSDLSPLTDALNCNIDVSMCSRASFVSFILDVTPSAYFAIRDDEAKLRRIMGKFAAFNVAIDPHDALRLMLILHLAATMLTIILLLNSVHVWAPLVALLLHTSARQVCLAAYRVQSRHRAHTRRSVRLIWPANMVKGRHDDISTLVHLVRPTPAGALQAQCTPTWTTRPPPVAMVNQRQDRPYGPAATCGRTAPFQAPTVLAPLFLVYIASFLLASIKLYYRMNPQCS